jgi:hypothetical protein
MRTFPFATNDFTHPRIPSRADEHALGLRRVSRPPHRVGFLMEVEREEGREKRLPWVLFPCLFSHSRAVTTLRPRARASHYRVLGQAAERAEMRRQNRKAAPTSGRCGGVAVSATESSVDPQASVYVVTGNAFDKPELCANGIASRVFAAQQASSPPP